MGEVVTRAYLQNTVNYVVRGRAMSLENGQTTSVQVTTASGSHPVQSFNDYNSAINAGQQYIPNASIPLASFPHAATGAVIVGSTLAAALEVHCKQYSRVRTILFACQRDDYSHGNDLHVHPVDPPVYGRYLMCYQPGSGYPSPDANYNQNGNKYGSLAAGNVISEANFLAILNAMADTVNLNAATWQATVNYCHSSCHTNCHTSRGRR